MGKTACFFSFCNVMCISLKALAYVICYSTSWSLHYVDILPQKQVDFLPKPISSDRCVRPSETYLVIIEDVFAVKQMTM